MRRHNFMHCYKQSNMNTTSQTLASLTTQILTSNPPPLFLLFLIGYPASCTMGTGSFPGEKRPGRDANHPPSSCAEVENE
jgi:hypothetical protein